MTTNVTLETLLQYEKLKIVQKQLDKDLSELGAVIIKEMESKGFDKTPNLESGFIQLESKKTWDYSNKVEEIKEKLKYQQEKEQLDGTATSESKPYLKYYPMR